MADLKNDVAEMLHDPNWYPHRFDAAGDAVQFIRADRLALAKATFLTDEFLPGAQSPRVVQHRDTLAVTAPAPHFIFHSAYCCSTLLANAFDMAGVSFGLKEPAMLNDISGWRRRGGQPAAVVDALKTATSLLARPLAAGEHMVIKPSNVINALAPTLLSVSPDSKALLLYTPLGNYLASIAKKGMWGRLWVRELFVKLAKDGLTDYGFSPEDILQQTDLQIAAIGWLAQHRLFAAMEQRFGPERVRSMQSETLLADPANAMALLCSHFGLHPDKETLSSTVERSFSRNAKTGDSFNADARRRDHEDSSRLYQDEIGKVVIWANAVAQAAGQNLTLNSPLI